MAKRALSERRTVERYGPEINRSRDLARGESGRQLAIGQTVELGVGLIATKSAEGLGMEFGQAQS
jgi:hypothetical protein